MVNNEEICAQGRAAIENESTAILALASSINHHFVQACKLLQDCKGCIIVMGVGKLGHIAKNLAATFASTGNPACFVHPGEAKHGDMGMVTTADLALILSNSGETAEILCLLPSLKRLAIPVISMTSNPNSTLAKAVTVNLDISAGKPPSEHELISTSNKTAALIMGDALISTLMHIRGYSDEDVTLLQQEGYLSPYLLLSIDSIMHTGNVIPKVDEQATLKTALVEMTQKKLGMVVIVNENQQLAGIFTDGDVRRVLDKNIDFHHCVISEVMSKNPKTIRPGTLATDALKIMNTYKITALIVIDEERTVLGVIHMHDILRTGIKNSIEENEVKPVSVALA